MEDLFLTLLNRSISAGWLILAVILLRLLLKKAPKWVPCVLWGLVGFRLVFPFSLESVLSLIPSTETVPPEILYAATPEIHSGVAAINSAVNPVLASSMAPEPWASVNPMQILVYLAARIWVLGILALLIYSLVSYFRLRRRVVRAVRLRDNLWQCETVTTPFLLGLFRPKIYLPFHLDGETLDAVAAHEQAHLQRRDHWTKPLAFLILTVYWFQPLVWVAYVLLCRDLELACDERVIRDWDPARKKAYAEALLSCSQPHRTLAACPLAFGEVGVKQRIKNVLHYRKPAFWILILAVLACIATAVCFLTDPKEEDPDSTIVSEVLPEAEPEAAGPDATEPEPVEAAIPADFAVCFRWWFDEDRPNVLDTYEGRIQKDLVLDGTAEAAYTASKAELEAMYELLVSLDAASIERTMTSAELTTDDTMVAIEPCTYYSVQFTMNGQTYVVQGDETARSYQNTDPEAARFCQLVLQLRQLTKETEAYRTLPEANGAYE